MFPELTRDDVFRIETRRLWLRWPRARDVAAIVRLAAEPAVAETAACIRPSSDRVEAEAFVLEARRGNAEGRGLTMALALRSDPAGLVGMVGLVADPEAGAGLGCWLGRPHWGRGLASEAATALIEAYFAYAGGTALTAAAPVGNTAACRLLEKTGFARCDTTMRGGAVAVDRFRLDRAAWAAQRSAGPGPDGRSRLGAAQTGARRPAARPDERRATP